MADISCVSNPVVQNTKKPQEKSVMRDGYCHLVKIGWSQRSTACCLCSLGMYGLYYLIKKAVDYCSDEHMNDICQYLKKNENVKGDKFFSQCLERVVRTSNHDWLVRVLSKEEKKEFVVFLNQKLQEENNEDILRAGCKVFASMEHEDVLQVLKKEGKNFKFAPSHDFVKWSVENKHAKLEVWGGFYRFKLEGQSHFYNYPSQKMGTKKSEEEKDIKDSKPLYGFRTWERFGSVHGKSRILVETGDAFRIGSEGKMEAVRMVPCIKFDLEKTEKIYKAKPVRIDEGYKNKILDYVNKEKLSDAEKKIIYQSFCCEAVVHAANFFIENHLLVDDFMAYHLWSNLEAFDLKDLPTDDLIRYFADQSNMVVIAEKDENEDQLAFLNTYTIDSFPSSPDYWKKKRLCYHLFMLSPHLTDFTKARIKNIFTQNEVFGKNADNYPALVFRT